MVLTEPIPHVVTRRRSAMRMAKAWNSAEQWRRSAFGWVRRFGRQCGIGVGNGAKPVFSAAVRRALGAALYVLAALVTYIDMAADTPLRRLMLQVTAAIL